MKYSPIGAGPSTSTSNYDTGTVIKHPKKQIGDDSYILEYQNSSDNFFMIKTLQIGVGSFSPLMMKLVSLMSHLH